MLDKNHTGQFYQVLSTAQHTSQEQGDNKMTRSLVLIASLIIALSHSVFPYVIEDGFSSSKTIRLTNEERQCDPTQACGIAVCPWHQDILFPDRESCIFMSTTCSCPPQKRCSTSQPIPSTPESGVIVFNFRCVHE